MQKQNLISITWKEGKYYVAQCLNVDISSFGKTRNEAIQNLTEALELYFEDKSISKIEKIERRTVRVESLAYA
jgi:predicted RNase H-like HicB family nuclease